MEDALARAAAGEDDLDEIGRRIERIKLDFEQWEILYRHFLQVRLRRSRDRSRRLSRRSCRAWRGRGRAGARWARRAAG